MFSNSDPLFSNPLFLQTALKGLRNIKPPKVYADPDYLLDYKGCKVQYPFYLNIDLLETFEARPSDVCVAAFPKTGTTWLSAVVYQIVHDADPKSISTGSPLKWKMPYLEMTLPYGDDLSQEMKATDFLASQEGQRCYVTHLNANALPEKVVNTAKIVYVYRNPKDTIVSMYHFMKAATWFGFNGTLNQVVDDFIEDRVINAPYFEHLETFWKLRSNPNIFITSFEEMSRNPRQTIERLVKFLEKDLTKAQIDAVVASTTFDKMKSNPLTSMAELETLGIINTRIARFMRKGQVGGWKNVLDDEINQKIDSWIAKNLTERPALQGFKFEYELESDLD